MKYSARLFILGFLIMALEFPAWADDTLESTADNNVKSSWWKRSLQSLEKFRDKTTEDYSDLSTSIDEFFYGKKLEETSNDSYLKLEIQNTFYKSGETEQDVKLKAKLDLPNTEKKFKLVFSSDAEKEESLEERVHNDASGERIEADESFAGVEYQPAPEKSQWNKSFTGGIKLRTPLLPFAKFDLDNKWRLSEFWTSEFEQSFWYLDDKGFGETSELSFIRPITDSYQLKVSSELEFRDENNTFSYDLILSTTHRLDHASSIEYYVGSLGESQPTNQVTHYILGANYRKLLHEDWLFLNIEPGLSFPREENWKAQPSFSLELQIYFTDN